MEYSTSTVPAHQRADGWRYALSETYFPLEISFRDETAFNGAIKNWTLGSIDISKFTCQPMEVYRNERHLANETESSLLITLSEKTPISFCQNGREVTCAPGSILIERGDVPYRFSQGLANTSSVVKVPIPCLKSRLGSLDRLAPMCFDGTHGVASYFIDTVRRSTKFAPDMDSTARQSLSDHLLEILCLAIQNDDRVLSSNTSSVKTAHLRRAEEYILKNVQDASLTPQKVADACGISLRYLQRLFNESNSSIYSFIRDNRLERCHEDLQSVSNTSSIAELAYKWGFCDQSQLCKDYKARYDETPSQTRKHSRLSMR